MKYRPYKTFLAITIIYIITATTFNVAYYLNYGEGSWFATTDIIGVLWILITIIARIKHGK